MFSGELKWKTVSLKIPVIIAGCVFTLLLVKQQIGFLPTWKNGESLWTRVIEVYPDHAPAYNNRASYYNDHKLYDKALKDVNKAIEIKPGFGEAHLTRGNILFWNNQFDQALVDYELFLAADSNSPYPINNVGSIMFNKGKYKEALRRFNRALEIKPDYNDAYFNRACAHAVLKMYDKAFADFESAIRFNPEKAGIYLNRSFTYKETGQFEKAIADP